MSRGKNIRRLTTTHIDGKPVVSQDIRHSSYQAGNIIEFPISQKIIEMIEHEWEGGAEISRDLTKLHQQNIRSVNLKVLSVRLFDQEIDELEVRSQLIANGESFMVTTDYLEVTADDKEASTSRRNSNFSPLRKH